MVSSTVPEVTRVPRVPRAMSSASRSKRVQYHKEIAMRSCVRPVTGNLKQEETGGDEDTLFRVTKLMSFIASLPVFF